MPLHDVAGRATCSAMTQNTPPSLALITGASRGLGAGIAIALAARGTHIMAVARTTGALEELDDKIKAVGGVATLAPMDITNDGAMQHLCRSVHERWGALPLWVHTAIHTPPLAPVTQIDAKAMDKSIANNIKAVSTLMTYVNPLLQAAAPNAHAVFLDDTSDAAFSGAYAATKAATRTLVRHWQREATTPSAPSVHLLEPAPTATASRARFYPGEDRSTLASPADEGERLVAGLFGPRP